jgi:hypothetical protein
MSATDRQNRLLVAEDWKRIYQTFRNADFQSYDFENLRRVMISYIRENYPEDFNDYIESSEYLALIDLIAFLGQSIAFRVDLNARENFLELAERRESVLRLARLLSYKPKRNIAASGLLKFHTVSTSQSVFDSNGRNLANQVVTWNDPANPNWYDQFVKVLNAALPQTRQFGNPDDKADIYGIPTEQYRFQAANTDVPVYNFTKTVDGRSMGFEIVSTVFAGRDEIYEESPTIGNHLAFLYRDDGKGNGSNNTGFFLRFTQGSLNQGTFTISQPATDETVDLDAVNINNSDVWVYRLDKNGLESEYWAPVPSFEGNNVIYNSLNKSIRNIYGVVTRASDRISLVFSDGVFGNLPQGTFRTYYRVSNGLSYTINPRDIKNISFSLPYVSNVGQIETLTISLNLQSSVANSSEAESSASIKARAPATYYTQNRMITGEDYNISPLSVNQNIMKIKSSNRSSSGISRYFDLVDPTGKYSKTNLFADDGIIYKEKYSDSFKFSYSTKTDIEAVIYNELQDVLKLKSLKDYYYSEYDKKSIESLSLKWKQVTVDTNQVTGYIYDSTLQTQKVGSYTSTLLRFFSAGALVKFVPPAGSYFDTANSNKITSGSATTLNAAEHLWCKVVNIAGDGTNNSTGVLIDGSGTIILNDIIPDTANIIEIIPTWRTAIEPATVAAMVDLIFANKTFGLRYDIETRTWKIILKSNLDTADQFSLAKTGDSSNNNLDASWLILFTTDTEYYTVKYRLLRHVFESQQQLRFYFDASKKIYDTKNNSVVKDQIKLLSINTDPASESETTSYTYDRIWEISNDYKGLDGYVDSKKIEITFADSDDDGVVDDPTLFEQINPDSDYIIQERYVIEQAQEDYRYVKNTGQVVIATNEDAITIGNYADGQNFYFTDIDTVKKLNIADSSFEASLDYKVFVGRDSLKFQYTHNADYETRIDPGLTNLIDIFVLTKQYDIRFRQWLSGSIPTQPLPPSADELYNLLSPDLNKIKSISDEIIYHSATYKVLFGPTASMDVQATFKVVKNPSVVISDNDIKTRVLVAINEFFALENWDFGDSFYFSELSTYVMNRLAPNLVNFIIVPKLDSLAFGSLFEIKSEKDQIFINGARIDDIEIISAITASKIKSTGNITSTTSTVSQQSITSTGSN